MPAPSSLLWSPLFAALIAGTAAAGVDAVRLESLLRQDCGACHGGALRGGLGRPLLPEALAGRDEATLAAIILDGIPGTPMPPWRPLLSTEEAGWLARRLLTGTRP